jgi:hypothetical protein
MTIEKRNRRLIAEHSQFLLTQDEMMLRYASIVGLWERNEESEVSHGKH